MTSTRKKQIRTLAILLIAVVGLTIGFAAFTSSLRIKTRLSVNPNKGTFNVKFSKVSNELVEDNVIPTKSSDIFEAFEGIIDNSGIPTISDLGGEFTQPGESITYEFYALNTGEYKAYLTDVIFGNVDGENLNKVCTSLDGTHQSEVDIACSNINIKVTVGSDILTTSRSNLVGHNLEPNASEKVKVEITYSSGGILPEVPFEVSFGDISMVYNSLEAGDTNTSTQTEYDFALHTPDICYFAVTDGNGGAVILNYNPNASDCSNYTSGEIPANVAISEISFSFNRNKCEAYFDANIDKYISSNPRPSSNEPSTPSSYCDAIEDFFEGGIPVSEYAGVPFAYFLDTDDPDWAIYGGVLDTSFGEPSGSYPVTAIGYGAFHDKNLTSITIPSTVVYIGENAFYENNLTSITIPNSVTKIDSDAFTHNLLTSISFGTGLTEIGEDAFSYNQLTSITIPNSVISIDDYAFNYNNLTSVEIGSGIETIESYAFGSGEWTDTDTNIKYGPNALTSVIIHVPSSNASNFTSNSQFRWADGYSDSNIVWSDS